VGDVPEVGLDIDTTTRVVLRPRDVSETVESEVVYRADTTQKPQNENLNPGTNPVDFVSNSTEVAQSQILSRRKQDNAENARPPIILTKALSSIGEADEPAEVEKASKTAAQSADVTRVDTGEGDAQKRSDVPAMGIDTAIQNESKLVEAAQLRSESLVRQVLKEPREPTPLNIIANTTERPERSTEAKGITGQHTENKEKASLSAMQKIPPGVLSSNESSKTGTQMLEDASSVKSQQTTTVVPEDRLAAADAKLADLSLREGKTVSGNRHAPELNVTTDSEELKQSVVSIVTATPADSAYTEGFPTPITPSSLGHLNSQTSFKDQNAIVDLASLHKDIARAEKLHAELDDVNMVEEMAKDLQACISKFNELREKVEAIAAAKSEGKNKATVTKKLNKKMKVVRDGHEKLTEQVAFLFKYKQKEVSKAVKESRKQEEVAREAQLLNENMKLKASEKKLTETIKKLKQEDNKSAYPKADPGASSMRLDVNHKPAYPKADPGASSMKLDPTSNTFKPGTRPPMITASDLHFDQDPTIDDTGVRMAAVNRAFAKSKAEGTAPIGQIFPSYETFLIHDLSQTLDRFPRRAPKGHRTEMDIARDEMHVPRHMNREGGNHAVSGAGLGITLPGMPGYVESRPTSPDDTVSCTTSPPLTPGLQPPKPSFSYASAASKGNLSELNAEDRARVKGKGKARIGASLTDEGPSAKAGSADGIIQGDATRDEELWKAPVEWGEEGYRPKRNKGKGKAAPEYGGVEMQRGG